VVAVRRRQLDGLVAQALATSPDARIAALRIEEADALLRQVDAALLPQVNADASGSRSRISQTNATPIPSTAPITRSSARLALSTSFELDVWGKLRRASRPPGPRPWAPATPPTRCR
jgi:multidrug efflux system outer membrane protein